MSTAQSRQTAEDQRLAQDAQRQQNWKRWGPYLAERQWSTVREDYSADGDCWNYLPHDAARSRAYRWGEDGLLGITDRECRLCFALALWNGRDPILKERLFGLTGPEGNHGEDVKELYYYLDNVPTHSYMKALYKYPQGAFPYEELVRVNGQRSRQEPEYELIDTHAFDDGHYFDVAVEYAKADPDDLLIRITLSNRGSSDARLVMLPTLWFRNTWSWDDGPEARIVKPRLWRDAPHRIAAAHATLGRFELTADPANPGAAPPPMLFTENQTNCQRLFHTPDPQPYVKDAFHRYVVEGQHDAVNPAAEGTKAALVHDLTIAAGQSVTLRLRLAPPRANHDSDFGAGFDRVLQDRRSEADAFYADRLPAALTPDARLVARQAYAGLLWTKQFYHYVVADWLKGDPGQPPPPPGRRTGRNCDWPHVYSRDVLSVCDGWEYPWFAAWDLAFHMVAFAHLDPDFAKQQLLVLLREWYMHPNGQIPAYEFAFSDVNPPVHAWAVWRVYKMTAPRGQRDLEFLERGFHKLMLNFTWWVNRKDIAGRHLFSGGFLGLDNIGVFDRSRPLPDGGYLEQADGTAWMAFYCSTMLSMAIELARHDKAYEDIASKFFEHFVAIVDAINHVGDHGLWNDTDGFYYDHLRLTNPDREIPIRVRSIVGLVPMLAVEVFAESTIAALPGFHKRMQWFLDHRPELATDITYMERSGHNSHGTYLLAVPSRAKLERLLGYLLDETEFLSPYGIRSLSAYYRAHPYTLPLDGHTYSINYEPAESETGLFGGNSNWRGPIWMPLNFLLLEALERYHHFYGNDLQVECPRGSGTYLTLDQVVGVLRTRLARIFLQNQDGQRPCHGGITRYATDPHWQGLLLFYEYFHGDNGAGLGASHQTGWTALIARLLEDNVGA
jgi:hypothetical protein